MDCARLEVEGSSTLNPIHKEEKVLIIFYDWPLAIAEKNRGWTIQSSWEPDAEMPWASTYSPTPLFYNSPSPVDSSTQTRNLTRPIFSGTHHSYDRGTRYELFIIQQEERLNSPIFIEPRDFTEPQPPNYRPSLMNREIRHFTTFYHYPHWTLKTKIE